MHPVTTRRLGVGESTSGVKMHPLRVVRRLFRYTVGQGWHRALLLCLCHTARERARAA